MAKRRQNKRSNGHAAASAGDGWADQTINGRRLFGKDETSSTTTTFSSSSSSSTSELAAASRATSEAAEVRADQVIDGRRLFGGACDRIQLQPPRTATLLMVPAGSNPAYSVAISRVLCSSVVSIMRVRKAPASSSSVAAARRTAAVGAAAAGPYFVQLSTAHFLTSYVPHLACRFLLPACHLAVRAAALQPRPGAC